MKHQWWCGGKEPCACTERWKQEQMKTEPEQQPTASELEQLALEYANKMEAAFQCGPRDVQRFKAIILDFFQKVQELTRKEGDATLPSAHATNPDQSLTRNATCTGSKSAPTVQPAGAATADKPIYEPCCWCGQTIAKHDMSHDPREMPSQPTSGKQEQWTLVPRASHFNIICDGVTIYEGVTSELQGETLVASHNASITAERERFKLQQKNYIDLCDAVLGTGTRIDNDPFAAVQQLREQLAAARKLQQLTEDNQVRWMQKHEESQKQLAAAQAAIKEHNSNIPADPRRSHRRIAYSDTTILNEYVAKECQPIVEALASVRRRFPLAANTDQREIIDTLDAALAQWKERKPISDQT